MTTDTTMTEVDTSMASPLCVEQSAKWLDEMHDQHTGCGEPTRFSGCASTIRALSSRCDELERLAGDAHELIKRYRKETPLGHQPHMIAHIADEWLEAYQRKGE